MGRVRKGSVAEKKGRLYARLQFVDQNGQKRDLWRKAENRKHAREIIKQLIRETDDYGESLHDAYNMTFAELADYFEKNFLTPAEYINGRKVNGVRSIIPAQAALKALKAYFGKRLIRNITYAEIRSYKTARLKEPTWYGSQRAIATVNRELCKARRLFNIAVREGWLIRNPFLAGESLVSAADENKRERILSLEEETRLLDAIDSEPKRAHLKGIVLLALDCALRRGEIFTLRWSDIDLNTRTVKVRAFNAKTAKSRIIAMTTRVYVELSRLWVVSKRDISALVFGIRVTIKTAWAKALKAAEITDFHFHDCRHTAITRMIRAGMPPVEVMRVSGHSTMSAFYRYANADAESAFRCASALDTFLQTAQNASVNASELMN